MVLLRQDPPFDMHYINATYFLEAVHPETLVVNDPVEVRNAPEKLFVTEFPGLQPPTLITSDRAGHRRLPRAPRRHGAEAAERQAAARASPGTWRTTPTSTPCWNSTPRSPASR